MVGKNKTDGPAPADTAQNAAADGMPTDAELDALQAAIDMEKSSMKERADTDKDDPDAAALTPLQAAEQKNEQLQAELASIKDQALRAMADAENVKKRAEREVNAARIFGIERFALDVLSVHDNLSRALLTLAGTNKEDLGENAKNLVDGIELTEKDLILTLSRHGVKAVPGAGSKFDPNVHQAVAQIPSDEDKGNVATVMQTGFKLGDRTLRAAMVAVSTGPAK
ncbi:MAG: nucleotide exchange factor GrpE [Litorimonas sp.]